MKSFGVAMALVGACLLVTSCNKGGTATNPAGHGFELENVTDQSVSQADTESIKVSIDRKGGFDGPITIELSGLPSGVTVDGGAVHTIMAKDSAVTLKLLASDQAVPTDKNSVTIKASANVDGQTLSKSDVFNLKVKAKS